MKHKFLMIITLLVLFACGYKGPLVLPTDKNQQSSPPSASANQFAPHLPNVESRESTIESMS
jgi:predicted small lipoprotein YifL